MELHNECERLFAEIDEAYRSGSAERAAGLATRDVIISPIDLPDIVGRDAVEGVLRQFFASAKVNEYYLTPREIDEGDRVAHVRGTFRWRCTMADGQPLNADGRFAAVLQHSTEGWRLHRLIENRLPAPSAA